jgi:hypothetical protein
MNADQRGFGEKIKGKSGAFGRSLFKGFLELLCNTFSKQKVPPAYSRADENARSLYGRRDDDDFLEE